MTFDISGITSYLLGSAAVAVLYLTAAWVWDIIKFRRILRGIDEIKQRLNTLEERLNHEQGNRN